MIIGVAQVIGTKPTLSLLFSIDNGSSWQSGNPLFENLPAGNYTLKVTSILNNCDTTINFTVNNDFTPMPLTETIIDMSDRAYGILNEHYHNGSNTYMDK